MIKARHWAAMLGAVTVAAVAAVGCSDTAGPPPHDGIQAGVQPGPPPKKGGECANFRLTGGGRTDDRSHVTANKSTPESHDFATFGFEARPNGCPDLGGRGNIEWNEHDLNAYGGGFAFHGTVTFFTTPFDAPSGQCGRFGGYGRMNPRNGETTELVPFQVIHACDVAEPGVGKDHIYISIGPIGDGGPTYERHGLLSGGNIQWHRLTGNN